MAEGLIEELGLKAAYVEPLSDGAVLPGGGMGAGGRRVSELDWPPQSQQPKVSSVFHSRII